MQQLQQQETQADKDRRRNRLIAREELRLKMLEHQAIWNGPDEFEYWASKIEKCKERIYALQFK